MPHANWRQRVVCDPNIHHGESTIRGTRICVATIVASLADLGVDDLHREFRQSTSAGIEVSQRFASC